MYKAQVKQAALAAHPADIAIVGMASHFPDAATLYEFWTNVVNKKDSIVDVDTMDGGEYWRKADFFDPNPAAIDKPMATRRALCLLSNLIRLNLNCHP